MKSCSLYNLEQGQLQLVPPLLPDSEVGEDKERGVRLIRVFEVIQRRYGCSSKKPRLAIVNDMKLVVLFVASDQTGKEKVVWVYSVSNTSTRLSLTLHEARAIWTGLWATKRFLSVSFRITRQVISCLARDLELDDGRRVNRTAVG